VKFISETCDHDHGTPGLLYSSDRVPDGQLVSRVTEATSAGVRCALSDGSRNSVVDHTCGNHYVRKQQTVETAACWPVDFGGEVGFAPDGARAGKRSGVGAVRIGGGEVGCIEDLKGAKKTSFVPCARCAVF
jgi:hypothetical protein